MSGSCLCRICLSQGVSISMQASSTDTCSAICAMQAKVREQNQEASSSPHPQQPAAYQTSVHGPSGSGQTVHAQPPLAPQPSTSQESSHNPLVRTTLHITNKMRRGKTGSDCGGGALLFLSNLAGLLDRATCVCVMTICSRTLSRVNCSCCVIHQPPIRCLLQ